MLMYLAPLMRVPKMDLLRRLGSMFTSARGVTTAQGTVSRSNDGLTLGLGVVIHFTMGVVFALQSL